MTLLMAWIGLTIIVPGTLTATTWSGCDKNEGKDCQVCHDQVNCFKMREACGENPANARSELPESLADIAPTFLLYDKKTHDEAVEMRIWKQYPQDFIKGVYANAGFDQNKPTKFLIQGFESANLYGLLIHVREQLAQKPDGFNIFMLNWVSDQDVGTVDQKKINLTYRRPIQNARVVGKYLGMFIENLNDLFKVTYDSVHLIGYNMGAHVAGYAGKYLREKGGQLGQITALAPSSAYFEQTDGNYKPTECRLDRNDARFVDAIHADRPSEDKITMGMANPIGHVDFYPNQGKDPHPGCQHMFCSHGRPLQYYEESIKGTCKYQSVPCKESPPCPPDGCPQSCPAGGCPEMGYNVNKGAQGVYCVEVTANEPFCKPKN